MTQKPKFSIITATLNSQNSIIRTLNSLKIQKKKDNIKNFFEHLIIDGGSKDKTLFIVNNFKKKNRYLKIYNSKNERNLYSALNYGLRKANGEIILFLHSDDVFDYDAVLLDAYRLFKEKKLDFLYGDILYTKNDKIVRFYKSNKNYRTLFKFGMMPAHTSLFIKKKLKKKIGDYDTQFDIASDFDYFIRLSSTTEMFAIRKALAFYRSHSSNFSKIKLKMYSDELNEWLKNNNKWLKYNNYDTTNINIWRYKLIIKIIVKKILNFIGF